MIEKRKRIAGAALVSIGTILVLHHGLVYGLWFDLTDPFGHDWYGVVLSVIGVIMLLK